MSATTKRLGDYSTDPANNNAAAPNGMPEGMAPSGVNDAWRENAARQAFNYGDQDIYLTDAGSASVYAITCAAGVAALAPGMTFKFKAATANAAAPTLTVTPSGGAAFTTKPLVWRDNRALPAGLILAGDLVEATYDSTNDAFFVTFDGLRPVLAKTADYTVAAADRGSLIVVNSGSAVAITIPTTVTSGIGNIFATGVKSIGAGVTTVTMSGSDLLDGAATLALTQYQGVEISARAAAAWVVSSSSNISAAQTLPTATVKTSGFTAAAGGVYPCDTSGGAFTVTLPVSPSAGMLIQLIDAHRSWGTNKLTLDPGASFKILAQTAGTMLDLDIDGLNPTIAYVDSTEGWVI